jgi:hypothetical protein
MGIVFRGIPQKLALELKQKHDLVYFVETGTLLGKSAAWASLNFKQVFTIEINRDFYKRVREIYGNNGLKGNVVFMLGKSQDLLAGVLGQFDKPGLVWLDAHWSRDLGYGRPEIVCPVLAELEAVRMAHQSKNVVMIDDARLFGMDGWPTVDEIMSSLGDRWVWWLQDDVLVAEPK